MLKKSSQKKTQVNNPFRCRGKGRRSYEPTDCHKYCTVSYNNIKLIRTMADVRREDKWRSERDNQCSVLQHAENMQPQYNILYSILLLICIDTHKKLTNRTG